MVMVKCKKCGHIDYADVPYNGENSFEGEQPNPGGCGGFVIKCSCGSTSFDVISQTGQPGNFPSHTPGHSGISVSNPQSPTSAGSFERLQQTLDRIELKLQEMNNRLKQIEQKP